MEIKYISQDIEWTEPMKSSVEQKIARPLARHITSENLELSVHVTEGRKRVQNRKPSFEMWVMWQAFDGSNLEIVRRRGDDFYTLVDEVSSGMRHRLRKMSTRRRHTVNPLRYLGLQKEKARPQTDEANDSESYIA